jgi:hypothetical protein
VFLIEQVLGEDLADVGSLFGDRWSEVFIGWKDNEILPLGEVAEAVSLGSAEVVSSRAWQGSN